jgi:hypothetical protein
MPRYLMHIKIFAEETEMAAESSDYQDIESFREAMIAYYETGDLAGLNESVAVGTEPGDEGFIGGDYMCRVSEMLGGKAE